MWGIDTLDWKTLDPVQTVENTMSAVKDGSIVLMHDIHAETVTAVESLLPQLIEAGYQLVTVDELLQAKGLRFTTVSVSSVLMILRIDKQFEFDLRIHDNGAESTRCF